MLPTAFIFNLSFEKGLVPDKLKLAKVVPVFKGGNELLPNNYRPMGHISAKNTSECTK